jgi:hypothetical protein
MAKKELNDIRGASCFLEFTFEEMALGIKWNAKTNFI